MVDLQLTVEEQEILADLLENYLSDLRMEIADTDRLEYRDMLKRRKAILVKLQAALQPALEQPDPEA